jgi:hypothetical protein
MRKRFIRNQETEKRVEQTPPMSNVPTTNIPPTNIPPTNIPPTNVPPTNVPPTNVPPEYNPQNMPPTDPNMTSSDKLYAFEPSVADELRSRWNSIQAQFVDQPCTAIEQADALVADALERIYTMIAEQQSILRKRWYDHEDVSTEELRVTLQDYRAYLNSLLDY